MTALVFAICIRESAPSCMRAPPDVATTIERDAALERVLGDARDALADDDAHGAADEAEVHGADVDGAAVEPCRGRRGRPR